MFNLQALWVVYTEDGSIPLPRTNEAEEKFGSGAAIARAQQLYFGVHTYLSNSVSRELDVDNWEPIVSAFEYPLEENCSTVANLKNLIKSVPLLSFFVKNINIPAAAQVRAIDHYLGGVSFSQISNAKRHLSNLHMSTWTRAQTFDEEQGGVSILGTISERLLTVAFDNLIDGIELFQSTNVDIKTYGDFVLLALPNNLWFSVKSGFSRERLLASGYFNDVIGVGFFEDSREFTSLSKVRNFKKVGFLAIYLPDTPVNQAQEERGQNTYEEVFASYADRELALPVNINGTPFFRKLSELGNDIERIKSIEISKRTTLSF